MAKQVNRTKSLAEKLDHLFGSVRRRNGTKYSYEEVAEAIAKTGVTISQSYIWQLHLGKKDNPTLKHMQAIADFFGVPITYFFDNAAEEHINRQLDELRAEQARLEQMTTPNDAQLMAMRASKLDPDRRKLVLDLLDAVLKAQQAERGADPKK